MALNDILTSMDGARDALVTAINAKGGSLAQDSTLYQCAHAVTNIDSNPGTDTTDATATASDILQDKTAYAKDEKITGTIPTVTASMSDNVVTVPKGYVKSAQTLTVGTALNAFTITPAANAQVISKGSYLKGEVTVAGDTNLTAANIKSGVTIFNVARTYEGESTGGTSAEYYKCASVDTGGVITDGKTLTVSGCMWGSYYNGTYALQDESATGYDRVWVHSDGRYALKYYTGISYIGNTNGGWGFFDLTYPNMDPDYLCEYDDANPWEHTIWQNAENGEEDNINIVPSTTTVPGNTWSGYKAVFDSTAGTWSFESDVTEGLTYTSVTPIVGGIYSPDALVIVSSLWNGIPVENLVFYLPLNKTTIADIGPELSASGTIVNTTMDSIPCAYFNGNSYLYASSVSIPTGASPRALSLWFRYKDIPGTTASDASVFAGWGTTSSMARFEAYVEAQELYIIYSSNYLKPDIKIQDTNWHHVLLQYDGSTSEIYYDGQLAASEAKTLGTQNNYLYVGARENGEYAFDGYLAGIRIYNRAMTGTEIACLASEFTPTT